MVTGSFGTLSPETPHIFSVIFAPKFAVFFFKGTTLDMNVKGTTTKKRVWMKLAERGGLAVIDSLFVTLF